MGLFNIKSILESEANDSMNNSCNTFNSLKYDNITFLEHATALMNEFKEAYRKCNINLHKNAITNNEIKYSKFFKETANTLYVYADKIKAMGEKAHAQFSRYGKTYNLVEMTLLDESVKTSCTLARLDNINNFSVLSLGEDFKQSLPGEVYNELSLRTSIDDCKNMSKKELYAHRLAFGDESFNAIHMNTVGELPMENFVDYLSKSYYSGSDTTQTIVSPKSVFSYAEKINNGALGDNVESEFQSVFEDMRIAADSILGMVDTEINSEAIPVLSPTEERALAAKNTYVNMKVSQFVENVCSSIIAAAFKADALFETQLAYRELCDSAENRIKYLKESGAIDNASVLIAEAMMEVK